MAQGFSKSQPLDTDVTLSSNSDYISASQKAVKSYVDSNAFTDEKAQDAVGTILADTATIDMTYTDGTPEIKADVKDGSITEPKLAMNDSPADGEVLAWNAGGSYMEWVEQTGGSADGWTLDGNTWSYSSGTVSVAYTNDPAAGSNIVLNVASTSGFQIGDSITVSSSAGSETTRISALVTNTSITALSLALNHTTSSPLITLNNDTFVISVNADVTATLCAGMRIKLTQTTTKYFLVTAVGAYSAGATLVTVYGGTDYTLVNAAISSPYYSNIKCPFGFPMSPAKWTSQIAVYVSQSQSTPTTNTWYNVGNNSIAIPIGVWNVTIDVAIFGARNPATFISARGTLSTANNTESDADLTGLVSTKFPSGDVFSYANFHREKSLTLTSRTTYYVNISVYDTATTLGHAGVRSPLIVRAISQYI